MFPRLLLINPWIYDFAAVNMWVRPLGLLQVAEFLSVYPVELAWIDCMDISRPGRKFMRTYPKVEVAKPAALVDFPRTYYRYGMDRDEFIRQLKNHLPMQAILLTGIMTYWYPGVFEVIRICKELAPRTPIILGGIYAQLFPRHAAIHSGADEIYTGTADEHLILLLQKLGLPLTAAIRPQQPYYMLDLYSSPTYAPLLTSSGCPFACPYCAISRLHPQFQQRSPEEIFAEIEAQQAQQTGDFAFYDDALLVNAAQHIDQLLEMVRHADWQVRFHTPNGLHARFLTPTTSRLMYQTGFKTIRLSLETTDPLRQKALGNKVETSHLASAIRHLRDAGFSKSELGVYLLYGLPGQPKTEVWESIREMQSFAVRIHLSEFSPIPQTVCWQELLDKNIITADIDPVLTNNSVFTAWFTDYTSEVLKEFKDTVAKINQTGMVDP